GRTSGKTSGSGRNGPLHFLIRKVEASWACIRSVPGIVNWPSWEDGTKGRSASLKTRGANLSNIIRGPKSLVIARKITNTEAVSNFGSLAIPTRLSLRFFAMILLGLDYGSDLILL